MAKIKKVSKYAQKIGKLGGRPPKHNSENQQAYLGGISKPIRF